MIRDGDGDRVSQHMVPHSALISAACTSLIRTCKRVLV